MDEDWYTCRRCKHGSVGDCDKCEASYEEGVAKALAAATTQQQIPATIEAIANRNKGE